MTGSGGGLSSFLPLILMVAIFYFLLIRPQQKRAKQRNAMLGSVKKGDQIVTIGGIHGTVMELREDTVVISVSENTKITIEKQAINQVKENEDISET